MRWLILSDIHSNLAALEAVLEDAPSGLPVYCLGDIVGYGPCPNECIQVLRSLANGQSSDVVCVVGNHDWAAINKVDMRDFNLDARRSVLWTQRQLTPENLDYLSRLPLRQVVGEYMLVHGSPREPVWEYILYAPTARENFVHFETPYCLVGHTHVPVAFRLYEEDGVQYCASEQLVEGDPLRLEGGRLIVNPGSVGQPRDGDARASYAILDTEARTLDYRRVSYDILATQRLMEEYGLPHRNVMRLSYGW
ncbi:MAG: metallophosphoesterase family protein [Anaerolineae bacterium]|nr:metallophosphoesterase family protein [Anaerolineae bacterium]